MKTILWLRQSRLSHSCCVHTGTGGIEIFSREHLSILFLLISVCGEVASRLAVRVVKMMHEPHWARLVLHGKVWLVNFYRCYSVRISAGLILP